MRFSSLLAALLVPTVPAALAGCSCDSPPAADAGADAPSLDDAGPDAGPPDPPLPAPFTDVETTARYDMPGLSAEAFVVRTELDVPHIYAANRVDAMRILGFIMARDRFFQMDLTRRLSQGRISELLGDAALATDLENRLTGAAHMADLYLAGVDEEEAAELDAYAAGINDYIAAVRARRLPAPRELQLGASFLGAHNPVDLMIEWTRRDVVATGASVLYGTSFETGDVGRSRAFEHVDDVFPATAPNRALRVQGLQDDIIDHYAPPNDISSAYGWGLETAGMGGGDRPLDPRREFTAAALDALRGVLPERGVLDRLEASLARVASRTARDPDEGYGSNGWAVMGSATADGRSLLSGDGHLELSVPPLFWQLGVDTMLLGGPTEDTRLVGATIAGLPAMGVGTNGRIAWTQTAYFADVTDWYTEELALDAEGMPRGAIFEGTERALVRVDEPFIVADVPALDSVGRTEMIPRFTTFDGRWITEIEGRATTADEMLPAGQSKVHTLSGLVVPGDVDGDGRITAVSFYYGPFDGGTLLRAFRQFTMADTVEDFRQALRHFIGYGGSMMAADREGSVVYSAYHAVPARDHLPRDPGTNRWLPGADPRRLLDGTRYGAWHLPLDARGRVDEAAAAAGAPNEHVVPFDQWPMAENPGRQYVVMANNDPGAICTDNDLFDDPYYIGGPWIEGYRGERIAQRLESAIAAGTASLTEMQHIQGDHHSNLGEQWASVMLDGIDVARRAAAGTPTAGSPEARMAARWTASQADYEEVERRITAWRDAGFPTPSGVETFYAPLAANDVEHSIATSIFHAWLVEYFGEVLGDEGIPSDLSPAVTGDTFRTQTMLMMEEGRGAGNPLSLGSFDPATNESVFFDDLRTTVVESSREIGLRAVDLALTFLRSPPDETLHGGFGTSDMNEWRWGYRHQVRFDSLVGGQLGSSDSPELALLLRSFQITPSVLPLMPDLPMTDPRAALLHFPRPGDQFDIDAANPGFDTNDWTHGSGPVFRMVIALGPDGVEGQNILPGGQSGFPMNEHFADQAAMWLGNQTIPMRYLPDEVAEGAVGVERFFP
ncbi:MAG: penicillin acylase family protein [Sandaracinus sp.]